MNGLLRQVGQQYPPMRDADDSVFAPRKANPGGPMGPGGAGFGQPNRMAAGREIAPPMQQEPEVDLLKMAGGTGLMSRKPFDPEGDGYDYDRAESAGLQPSTEEGENKGHWGSVAPTTDEERQQFGLPEDSYVILKGRGHPTFEKAVEAELQRGAEVVKLGDRYFSISRTEQSPTE